MGINYSLLEVGNVKIIGKDLPIDLNLFLEVYKSLLPEVNIYTNPSMPPPNIERYNGIMPPEIMQSLLGSNERDHKLNKYHSNQHNRKVYFSYHKDDFILEYNIGSKDVFLYGKPSLLFRILSDMAYLSASHYPLHASTVFVNGHSFTFAGDSGSGKSVISAILLRDLEGKIIADDISLLECGKIFPTFKPLFLKGEIKRLFNLNATTEYSTNSVPFYELMLLRKDNIVQMRRPFQVFLKNSYWASDICGIDNVELHVRSQIRKSIDFWMDYASRNKVIIPEEVNITEIIRRKTKK